MHHPTTVARPANQSLARVLAHAIDAAGKPRHRIASECGMHRETLLRLARGERPAIYQRMSEGRFPRSRSLGPKCVVWVEAEINDWMRDIVSS